VSGRVEPLFGVELGDLSGEQLPPGVQFVLCPEKLLPGVRQLNVPAVVLIAGKVIGEREKMLLSQPGVVGWIEEQE
jgi:hypothetical protein